MRQALGPILAAASEEARIALRQPREHAIAVVLHFVEPLPGLGRLGNECCKLRRDELRQLGACSVLGALGFLLHALGPLGGYIVAGTRLFVVALDEEPRRLVLVAARACEHP